MVLVLPDLKYCELIILLVLRLGFLRDESFLYCRKLKVPVWDPDSKVDPEKENIFTHLWERDKSTEKECFSSTPTLAVVGLILVSMEVLLIHPFPAADLCRVVKYGGPPMETCPPPSRAYSIILLYYQF